jgi:hypothetical protein
VRRLVALLVLAATTGCAAGPQAVAAGTPAPATSTTDGATPKLAPPVPAPRNARGVAACNLLTTEQKRAVDADLRTEEPIVQGSYTTRCSWRTAAGDGALLVSTAPDFPIGGLEGLYLLRSTYAVFQPDELAGFPIVRAEAVDTGDKDCTIYVGIADDQLIWATANFPFTHRPKPSCTIARRMAAGMIANLPPLR